MRILIHGINYAPEVTSTGKYTGEMGEWLAARGHEVRVVTAPPYYPMWAVGEGYSAWEYRREWVAGAQVWRCPLWVPKEPSGSGRILHLASFAAGSFPVMLRQALWRPDVTVMVAPTLMSAPQSWLTARLAGGKLWVHVQDFELDAAMGLGVLGSRARRLLHTVEHRLFQMADRVSTITEAMRRRAVEKGVEETKTVLFPNWSDIKLVRPMTPDPAVRQSFGAGPGDLLVLYAGNMGEKQGLDLVLETAQELRPRRDIKFALVGSGAARARLEQAALDRRLYNVRFFPMQPLELLPLMLAAADVHLVVQKREAADLVMPSKLTNILSAGRPSVATAEPGTALHDTLDNHDCGLVTAPGSSEQLTAAIVTLVEDAGMREQMGRNARRYAEAHLDRDEILSAFEEKLRELAKERE